MNRALLPVWTLVGWSLFVWVSRVRNVLANDDLGTGGTVWRLIIAALFVVGGLVVGWLAYTETGDGVGGTIVGATGPVVARPWTDRLVVGVTVLAIWTIGLWLVRGIGILLDSNHDAGFKAVHTVLMVVSIVVALGAWRAVRRPATSAAPVPSPPGGGPQ
ncbi:MAG: hypothetical protein GY929_02345 [Actinomycetia bacterium]|nr:hypothetical protein [Actinomycetes bacterium]